MPNERAPCPDARDYLDARERPDGREPPLGGRQRVLAACGPRWSPARAIALVPSWRAGSGTGSSRTRRPRPVGGGST